MSDKCNYSGLFLGDVCPFSSFFFLFAFSAVFSFSASLLFLLLFFFFLLFCCSASLLFCFSLLLRFSARLDSLWLVFAYAPFYCTSASLLSLVIRLCCSTIFLLFCFSASWFCCLFYLLCLFLFFACLFSWSFLLLVLQFLSKHVNNLLPRFCLDASPFLFCCYVVCSSVFVSFVLAALACDDSLYWYY